MKKLPTPEELGLNRLFLSRYREKNGWREVILHTTVSEGGMHVQSHLADFLGGQPSYGTFDLVKETVDKARALGYDAWMCDNNPKNGGWINAKEEK